MDKLYPAYYAYLVGLIPILKEILDIVETNQSEKR
jgi:hypothetical protein